MCSVTLSGGQYCSTDRGDSTYANPGDNITINCVVTDSAAEFKMNVLRWSIPSHNISITNTNGEDSSDVSRNNFVSTVSNYDDESYITNASLTFPSHIRFGRICCSVYECS